MKDTFTLRMFYDDMGTFTQPGCRDLEDALWHVNSARAHDNLKPMNMDTFESLFGPTNKGWARLEIEFFD